jgi:hypothetical protein
VGATLAQKSSSNRERGYFGPGRDESGPPNDRQRAQP